DVDVAAFRSHYSRLRTYEPLAPVFEAAPIPHVVAGLEFGNGAAANTAGIEVAAHWTPTRRWRLDGSYTGFHYVSQLDPRSQAFSSLPRDGNAPTHQWQAHSTFWIGRRAELNAGLYHVGQLRYFDVPAYTRADLRFEWKLNKGFSLVGVGQNL